MLTTIYDDLVLETRWKKNMEVDQLKELMLFFFFFFSFFIIFLVDKLKEPFFFLRRKRLKKKIKKAPIFLNFIPV